MGNNMNHIGQKGVGILMRDFARYPDRQLSKAFKTFNFDDEGDTFGQDQQQRNMYVFP